MLASLVKEMAAAREAATSAGGADASARLRSLCLSAAVGISDECDYVLGVLEATSSDSGGVQVERTACDTDHAAEDDGGVRDEHYATINGSGSSNPRATLGGCGEPLVRLLSRQALRIVSLYKNEPPVLSLTPARSVSAPSSASPGHAGMKAQQSDAVHTSFVSGDDHRQRTQGRRGDGGGPALHNEPLVLKRLDDLISISYARFYAYLYKDLPLCWRQLYTDAAILKFSFLVLLFLSPLQNGRQQPDEMAGGNTSHATCLPPAQGRPWLGNTESAGLRLDEMIKTLDLALILAGAGGHARGRVWIDQAFVLLESACIEAGDISITTPALDMVRRESAKNIAVTSPGDLQPPAKRIRLDADADPSHCTASWGQQPSFSSHEPFTPPVRCPISRTSAELMDMPAFQRYLDNAPCGVGPEPLVLTGLADRWPARTDRPWAKPSYLLSRTFVGRRLVPVEIGRSYVDEGWGQKIVSFGEFLGEYIDRSVSSTTPPAAAEAGAGAQATTDPAHTPVTLPPPSPPSPPQTAYLAQHQLLLQLPQLRADVLIPDHCYTAPPPHPSDPLQDRPELDEPLLHAWLGPSGTITPLHTDPYHNLLVQVVGRKYVRLYAPRRDRDRGQGGDQGSGGSGSGGGDENDEMRARGREGGVDMGNTSRWDVGVLEGWDARPDAEDEEEKEEEASDERKRTEEEEFRKVPFMDCILEPGDTLYIPIGWWHYVRGLSVSFSVSIWWN